MNIRRVAIALLGLLSLALPAAAQYPQGPQGVGPQVPGVFTPSGIAVLDATNVSSSIQFPSQGPFQNLLVINSGPSTAYVAIGNSSVVATLSSVPLMAGQSVLFPQSINNTIAAITASGTAALSVQSGSGIPFIVYGAGGASGGGTVTDLAVTTGNGFSGTVTNPTTTPSIALSTTVTGILKGSGGSLVGATAGTDFLAPAGNGSALTGLTWGQISSTPTTLSGYGITNGATSGANSNITSLSGLTTPLTVAQGGTGLNNASASNGSLLIGNGSGFTLGSLTAGANVTITNSAGGITIAASGGGGGSPGGSNGEIQFNNSGSFGGLAVTGTGLGVLATGPTITLNNATGLPLSTGVTGTLQAAQEPAHTGDVTNSAGSLAMTVGAIGGHAVSLSGAVTTSGAFGLTLTTTGTTSLTLPTSGTVTALGNTASGTGSIVLATSPTLVTPTMTGTTSTAGITDSVSITSPQMALGGYGTPNYVWTGAALTQTLLYSSPSWSGTSTISTGGVYVPMHSYVTVSDRVNADNNAAGVAGTAVDYINLNVFGPHQGDAAGIAIQVNVVSSPASAGNEFFGIAADTAIDANLGGTGLTSGTAAGHGYAANFSLSNNSSATYMSMMSVEEIAINAGVAPLDKYGIYIAERAADAAQGTDGDEAVAIWNFAAVGSTPSGGWKTGIGFGGPDNYFPVSQTGTLIQAIKGSGDSALTVGSIVDVSAISTVSNYYWKSSNWTMTGAGVSSQVGSATFGSGSTNGLTISGGSGAVNMTTTGSSANLYAFIGASQEFAVETSGGNQVVQFKDVAAGSGVSRVVIENAASGGSPEITVLGGTNTQLNIATVGSGIIQFQNTVGFATSTTGSGTQTFTNSPCTGLTTEKWIPTEISGVGTGWIPFCQ